MVEIGALPAQCASQSRCVSQIERAGQDHLKRERFLPATSRVSSAATAGLQPRLALPNSSNLQRAECVSDGAKPWIKSFDFTPISAEHAVYEESSDCFGKKAGEGL